MVVRFRWKLWRNCCQIKAWLAPYNVKWCHVLALLWLYHLQIRPSSFAGMIDLPSSLPLSCPAFCCVILFSLFLLWLWAIFYSWNFFLVTFILTAAGEQFIFIFMDCLYDVHGESRETSRNYQLIDLLLSIPLCSRFGFLWRTEYPIKTMHSRESGLWYNSASMLKAKLTGMNQVGLIMNFCPSPPILLPT